VCLAIRIRKTGRLPAGSVEKILYDGSGPAEAEITDDYGILHRLWRVSDPATIRLLTTAMDDKVSVYDLILNSEETVSYFPLSMRPESVG